MDHLCCFCLVFVVLSRLFFAALCALALVCDVELCFCHFPM